ncbi:MAG TPA: MotA/TolQ/ExbB proton channel family protein [Chthoniobacter sp.]|jgi:biopolymer transport protein ExbB/TolQ
MNLTASSGKTGAFARAVDGRPGAAAKPRMFQFLDIISVFVGIIFIVILDHLPLPARLGSLLLDQKNGHMEPLSIHTVIWIIFFIGLGRLLYRLREAGAEEAELKQEYLPEGDDIILTNQDLGELYKKLRAVPRRRYLPRLLERTVAQFQGNKSVAHAHTLLDSCLDLYLHELDLGYHMIRYIVWLIPTIGFIGSVIGIGSALAVAGATKADDPNLLTNTTSAMSIAFNGTFLALLLSAALVFLMHIAQMKEEKALNASAQYCLDQLINRLIDGGGKTH